MKRSAHENDSFRGGGKDSVVETEKGEGLLAWQRRKSPPPLARGHKTDKGNGQAAREKRRPASNATLNEKDGKEF